MPAKVGPAEQPMSPPNANSANSVVPPREITRDAVLKEPGQRIPTERPQIPHPSRLRIGKGAREIIR